jgi:hypothetical protein
MALITNAQVSTEPNAAHKIVNIISIIQEMAILFKINGGTVYGK